MKLYHYTTFTNFCSIWLQQKLKFSEWTNCNDVYEREKTYKYTQLSLKHNGKTYPPGVLKQFSTKVFEEVERYHQLSFCLDYENIKGKPYENRTRARGRRNARYVYRGCPRCIHERVKNEYHFLMEQRYLRKK